LSKRYRVHEFAQLAGVTVKALHHYDRLGLLRPARSEAGYRVYTDRDLERLEQIVALKFLGVPLKQARALLDRSDLELQDALRLQIAALEEKQQLLARALSAIRTAEQSIEPGKSAAPALLKRIIEVIDMQDSLEAMKKYFSDEAWVKQRPRYEHGPSPEWQAIYREAGTLLGTDPGSDQALDMARRWLERLESDTGGDPSVLLGRTLAWDDREHWPAALRREIEEYNLEAVYKFFSKAVLEHRKRFAADDFWIRRDPRAQSSVPWYWLFLEPRVALDAEPGFPKSDTGRAQWVNFLHRSTRVDEEVQARSVRTWEEKQEGYRGTWSALASLADGSLGHDSGSEQVQQLASMWMDLRDRFLSGDFGVPSALRAVPAAQEILNRQDVRDFLGAALFWPLQPYFSDAACSQFEERSRRVLLTSLQQSARAHIAIYRDTALAPRWATLVSEDAGGDPEIEAAIHRAWQHRGEWPERLRQHVACLHLVDLETFDSIAGLLS
jgi:DNA-binding transcriptional MerR regulator